MSTAATSLADAPRYCDPDHPPEKFAAYPRDFDMIDGPEHLAHWPELRGPLEACASAILEPYKTIDALALRNQGRHRKLASAATWSGGVALLLGIFQLVFEDPFKSLKFRDFSTWEVAVTAIALVAVVIGIWSAVKANWLVERHKAERLRLLKFRFLTHPDLWCGDGPFGERVEHLQADVKRIRAMGAEEFRTWAEELDAPDIPEAARPCPIGGEALRQLMDYYRAKRLVYQRLYFKDRTLRHVPMAWLTGWLAPVLFFGSVACVLLHYAMELFVKDPQVREMGRVLIFLAAALPTVSAVVRTVRSSNEFARNKVRYRAKELNLTHLDGALQRTHDPNEKYRDVEYCERVLELEHREWARLMLDTEILP